MKIRNDGSGTRQPLMHVGKRHRQNHDQIQCNQLATEGQYKYQTKAAIKKHIFSPKLKITYYMEGKEDWQLAKEHILE